MEKEKTIKINTNMDKENLAKEYAYNLYGERTDERYNQSAEIFDAYDIEDAFNAGRNSVIENAPELKWKDVGLHGSQTIFENVCYVETLFGCYSITYWYVQKEFTMNDEDGDETQSFKSMEEAKQYASNLHKERIKKALGL